MLLANVSIIFSRKPIVTGWSAAADCTESCCPADGPGWGSNAGGGTGGGDTTGGTGTGALAAALPISRNLVN
jgi:hypothetical protein